MNPVKKAVIIGGGLGGLFTGAFLAKNGVEVTILEKNMTIGGGLQTFTRNGISYVTGMHILGGFQPGGSLYRMCRYLGILDKLEIQPMPKDCMAEIVNLDSDRVYKLPHGRDALSSYLIKEFPAEADGINKYFDQIYNVASSIDLFNLRTSTDFISLDSLSLSVGDFLDQFTTNIQLSNLLAFASSIYGGVRDKTPFYVHALISVLYQNGSSKFVQGSQCLADALADIILANNGQVKTNEAVSAIDVENRVVQSVRTVSDNIYKADYYISSIHPTRTIELCSEGAFTRAYVNRLSSIPNSYSAFKVYYEVRRDSFEPPKSPVYLLKSKDKFWSLAKFDDSWPHGAAIFVSERENDDTITLMAACPMEFDAVRKWEGCSIGSRPEAYKKWKEEQIQKVTDMIAMYYPVFPDAIQTYFAATPLTFRDWLGSPEGTMFGFCKDANNMLLSHLPIYTKISNLLLTGQCINLHGICGVPLTAILTAEAILGKNTIIDGINKIE